jgi:hypothetical protein
MAKHSKVHAAGNLAHFLTIRVAPPLGTYEIRE